MTLTLTIPNSPWGEVILNQAHLPPANHRSYLCVSAALNIARADNAFISPTNDDLDGAAARMRVFVKSFEATPEDSPVRIWVSRDEGAKAIHYIGPPEPLERFITTFQPHPRQNSPFVVTGVEKLRQSRVVLSNK